MRFTITQATIILLLYSYVQQTSAYSIYVFVTRIKDFVDGPFAYMYIEETVGNRDCQYFNVTTSYVQDQLNFTPNNCSSTLYPDMAVVYKHPLYPRNISHVVSKDRSLTFICTPFRDYTENDSMEYDCLLARLTSFKPPISSTLHSGDFTGQIVIIPGLIFLAVLLLLVSFLFRTESHPTLL